MPKVFKYFFKNKPLKYYFFFLNTRVRILNNLLSIYSNMYYSKKFKALFMRLMIAQRSQKFGLKKYIPTK